MKRWFKHQLELIKYYLGFTDWKPYKAKYWTSNKNWKNTYRRVGSTVDCTIKFPKGIEVDHSKVKPNN